ncbi:hypothetical protein ACN47E_001241 [Coniothyrium glycines]
MRLGIYGIELLTAAPPPQDMAEPHGPSPNTANHCHLGMFQLALLSLLSVTSVKLVLQPASPNVVTRHLHHIHHSPQQLQKTQRTSAIALCKSCSGRSALYTLDLSSRNLSTYMMRRYFDHLATWLVQCAM